MPGHKAAAPDDNRHAERVGPPGHLLTDAAVAEEPECTSEKTAGLRVLFLVPDAGAQVGDVVRHAPIQRKHQRKRQFGDGNRVLARTIRDVNASLRRGSDVDRVVARTGPHHQRQGPGLEHRRRHRRTANYEHLGRGRPNGVGERLVFQVRLVDDVAAGRVETVDATLLEFVGDQDLH